MIKKIKLLIDNFEYYKICIKNDIELLKPTYLYDISKNKCSRTNCELYKTKNCYLNMKKFQNIIRFSLLDLKELNTLVNLHKL